MKKREIQDLFKWNRIVFTDIDPKTDIFLYRQMCEMLVPQKYSYNRFRIHASEAMTDFYVGSDDSLSLKFMKSFFSRLYQLKFEDVDGDMPEAKFFTSYRITGMKMDGPIMVPSFLQNVAFIHRVAEQDVFVDVAVYRHRKEKAGISVRIGFSEVNPEVEKILKKIHLDVIKFSRSSGIKMRKTGRTGSYHIMKGIDPRYLINFLRVPLDEDI